MFLTYASRLAPPFILARTVPATFSVHAAGRGLASHALHILLGTYRHRPQLGALGTIFLIVAGMQIKEIIAVVSVVRSRMPV